MTKNRQIIFHNFPKDSNLLDELIISCDSSELNEFHVMESSMQTIEFVQKNPDSFIVFYNDSPSDYIQTKSMLKQVNYKREKLIHSMAIVNNADAEVEKSLKELGVIDIFTNVNNIERIISNLKKYLIKDTSKEVLTGSQKKKNENVLIKENRSKAGNNLNLVVNNQNNENEELTEIISEKLEIGLINLDSGKLNSHFSSEELGLEEIECKIDAFSNNSLEIEVMNAFVLNESAQLDINVIFIYNSCKIDIKITGNIENIEEVNDYTTSIKIKLKEDETVSLENFMALYQKRQKSIDDFMALAKGH